MIPPRSVPPSASALLEKARALRQTGRVEESIPLMQRAIAANPADPQTHYGLGLVLSQCQRIEEAIPCFERALRLKPDFADAYHALGIALRDLGRLEPAMAMLRRSIELAPRRAEFHARLGDILHTEQGSEAAQSSFRSAASAARNTTFGRICQAKLLICEHRVDEAAETIRRALTLDPKNLDAINLAGQVLSYAGELDAAAAHFDRALALAPDQPWGAWCGLARCRKMTEGDRPLIARIESLLTKTRLQAELKMRAQFALGKAFDDLGDYEPASRSFDAANRLRRKLRPFDRGRLLGAVECVLECFTPRFFEERHSVGAPDETPLFVLGMPRSGTTLVEQLLSGHSKIAAAGELEFWPIRSNAMNWASVEAVDAHDARRIAHEYLAVLRRYSADAARVTDKMPFNFIWSGLIRLIFPNAGIIHCRRNPVDTCLSIYVTDFEANLPFASDRDDLVFFYRQYLRLMAHWRAVLGQNAVTEVEYERLTVDTATETRRLIAFAGLEWEDACLRPERNKRAIETASLWQARQPVYRNSVERWRNYEPWLGALKELHEISPA